jgi:hypothetical protein
MSGNGPSPAPGDFSWCRGDGAILADAYQAVEAAGAWDFFATVEPPADKGYMFWDAPELKKVQQHMKLLDTHSGASYAFTMRTIQAIATRGWSAWVANRMDPRSYSSG